MNLENSMIYKNRIKELRNKMGKSQEEVAAYLKCSTNNFSRYERGERKADYDFLLLMSKYFHVTINYILCDDSYGG